MTGATHVTRILENVRGHRYGEMLLVKAGDQGLVAEVFNSYTLGECPQDLWEAFDLPGIAASEGALAAVANGPRYWLVDTIEKSGPPVPDVRDFGGILMTRAAVLNLGAGFDPSPYIGRRVTRSAVFSFASGSTVYELSEPGGAVYVMQSWCTSVDTRLAEPGLGTLAGRLEMPEGWTYGHRRIHEDLHIMTSTEEAVVLQDEFRNSYCLVR